MQRARALCQSAQLHQVMNCAPPIKKPPLKGGQWASKFRTPRVAIIRLARPVALLEPR